MTGQIRASVPRIAAFLAVALSAHAQTTITVDATSVVADLSGRGVGINTDYLMDDDGWRSRAVPLAGALTTMGVKFVRYPGGEKSDNYLWGVAPFGAPDVTLANAAAWPNSEARFFPDGKNGVDELLDFDEFMTACRAVGSEPVLVICFDSMYKNGGPTKALLKESAVEWVRYANVTKGYGIKYWELGNETDYGDSYAGSNPGAAVYAADLAEFSQAMKAVDPSILVGANGHSTSWFNTVLGASRAHVDFLAVHTYPTYDYTSYDRYRTSAPDFTGEVNKAVNAINALPGSADRERLFVALTEYNAIYWGSGTGWANVNDLGHALAVFEMTGQFLKKDKLAFSLLWNTRWVNNDAAGPVGTVNQFQAADNPAFESGTTGWSFPTGASITTTASEVHDGTAAARLSGPNDVFLWRSVPSARLSADAVYTFGVWAKVTGTANWCGAGIDFFSKGKKVGGAGITANKTTYSHYVKPFVTPESFDDIQIWAYKTGGSDILVVDGCAVTAGADPSVNDALDRDGNLNPTGRALAIWGSTMQQRMVSSTSTTSLRTFATHTPSTNRLTVYLVNKELSQATVGLSVRNYIDDATGEMWALAGSGPGDLAPSYDLKGAIRLTQGTTDITLPPVSITTLDLAPATGLTRQSLPHAVLAEAAEGALYDLCGRLIRQTQSNTRRTPTTLAVRKGPKGTQRLLLQEQQEVR